MEETVKNTVAFFLLSIVFLLPLKNAAAGHDVFEDSLEKSQQILPLPFQQKLDSLKEEDQLEGWLNAWYDFLAADPVAHYHELMLPLNAIWREPQTVAEQVSWFYLLIFSGYYELQQGNILKSTDVYEKAYQLVQKTKAVHDNEVLEYLIKPLGNNYTRLGDYERATFIQKEGLKLAERMGDSMQVAAAYANLSTTARWNSQLEEALVYAEKGLKSVKAGAALQGLLMSTKADILQEKGELGPAHSLILKAIRLFSAKTVQTGSNAAYWYAGALITAGDISQKRKHFEKAKTFFLRAFYTFQKDFPRSRQREKMKIQVALGQVYLSQKDFQIGLQHFNKALYGLLPEYNEKKEWPVDSLLYAENTLLDALTGKAELLNRMGEADRALAGYQKAAVVLQELRETIFSKEARRLLQQQSLQTTEEAIRLAYQLYKKTGKERYAEIALQFTEQQKARLLLDDLQKNITSARIQNKDSLFIKQSRLHQAIAFYTHSYMDAILQNNGGDSMRWQQKIGQTRYELSLVVRKIKDHYPVIEWNPAVDVKKLFTRLPRGAIAWEYFSGFKKWYGFRINREGIKTFSSLGEADQLKEKTLSFINHWFAGGPQALINHPEEYFEKAYALYSKIGLGGLEKHTKLFIIPDGVLGKLPFEALLTDSGYHSNPQDWPYLLLKAVTGQSYSLAVWNRLQEEFSTSGKREGFAGFFISPPENSKEAVLAGVKEEERDIRSFIRGYYYKNKSATAKELLQSMQTNEVIHISTHAFLIGEKQIPALQMADQKIFLADLYAPRVRPALVVISACQTANGLLSPGEGVLSLAREFTAIGAGGVVAALWSINDETAARLTALFYKKLQQSGNKAEALYRAKKDWISDNKRNAVLKLPYYWAGLVYYGNNRPLAQPLEAPFHFPKWGWGILVILLVILGWRFRKPVIRLFTIPGT